MDCWVGRDFHVFESQGRALLFSVDRSTVVQITSERLFTLLKHIESDRTRSPGNVLLAELGGGLEDPLREALEAIAPYTVRPPSAAPYVPHVDLERGDAVPLQKLTLMISEVCNLRCKYCFAGMNAPGSGQGLMSEAMARRTVDFLFTHMRPGDHRLHLIFFGGEPLLNKKVMGRTIEYAQARATAAGKTVGFDVTTNGVLLDEEFLRYLKDKRCGVLLSCDGPSRVHDRYRVRPDGSGSHEAVERAARLLLRETGELYVRATWSADGASLAELVEYFGQLAGSAPCHLSLDMMLPTPQNTTSWTEDRLLEALAEWARQFELHRDYCYRSWLNGRVPLVDVLSPAFAAFDRTDSNHHCQGCTIGLNLSAVGADGTLYLCHRFWPDRNYSFGSIDQGYDARKASALLENYHGNITAHCRECWARYLCMGACPWGNADDHAGFAPPGPEQCRVARSAYESVIGWYGRVASEAPDLLGRMKRHAREHKLEMHRCKR